MVFMVHTVYPPAINLLLQIGAHGVKTVSKSPINGEFLTWTSKPDYANSNPAIAPR
jgi:hypothetical protein